MIVHAFEVKINEEWKEYGEGDVYPVFARSSTSTNGRTVYTATVMLAGVTLFTIEAPAFLASSHPDRSEEAEAWVMTQFAMKLKDLMEPKVDA